MIMGRCVWRSIGCRRTSYGHERAIADVRAAGFPDAEEFIDKYLRKPFGPDEASALFESMAR